MLNKSNKKYSKIMYLSSIMASLTLTQSCSGSSINTQDASAAPEINLKNRRTIHGDPNNTNNNVSYQQFAIWYKQLHNNEILRQKNEVEYKKFVLRVSWNAHGYPHLSP